MEGAILSDKTEVLRRWNEHFNNLLNNDNGEYEALTGSMESQNQDGVEPPSLEEDIKDINKLKDIIFNASMKFSFGESSVECGVFGPNFSNLNFNDFSNAIAIFRLTINNCLTQFLNNRLLWQRN
ncbi:hypothetical protein TNIN_389811 [Trichonephila inaurata madagascariensis]|uniref:Uncharacterized protein n=1 Tax=Trichonephila inaurata madagascariensis TaxID=2747483 RepID=A0A8X7BR19_9ARAC|nr:hypothetical protein TNIN_389811 [Trichonephila inaurata madagascariensis]